MLKILFCSIFLLHTDLEEESVREDASTALELIVNDAADANNELLVEAFRGDDIVENKACDAGLSLRKWPCKYKNDHAN